MQTTPHPIDNHIRNALWAAAEKAKGQKTKNILSVVGFAIAHAQERLPEMDDEWKWFDALVAEITAEVAKQ